MKKGPFIKKIKTKTALYVYDVNSNQLIRVNEAVYDLIDLVGIHEPGVIVEKLKHRYPGDEIRNYIKGIEDAKSQHYLFSSNRPVISSVCRSQEHVEKAMKNNLSQMILEVTSNCNLRCKYCSFSGRYSSSRTHQKENLPLDTAIKAVEYFIGNSKADKSPPAISFYGGEPCLNFGLIREIVEFTKKKGVFQKFHFGLTTNATLLTDEIIKFFVDNDFALTVSLDGPQRITDRFRVFKNGEGTFDTIVGNLKKIKHTYPAYFKRKVLINAVMCPPYPFDEVIAFFFRQKLFKHIWEKVSINWVDEQETTFIRDFDLEKDKNKRIEEIKKLRRRYKESLIRGTYDQLTLEKSFFLEGFHTISNRAMNPMGTTFPPLGTCLPGQRRIFVSTEGKFYMCERVGSNCEIGDVDTGLNFKRIFDFLKAYDAFFKDCGNCWALRLCKKCFNNVRKGDAFDEEKRTKVCKLMLNNIEANLITYCEIIEENPDAFDVFKNVVMT